MASREDLKLWFLEGRELDHDFMIIACDTFDNSTYPIYTKLKDFWRFHDRHNNVNMQKIVEVYNLKIDMITQLQLKRAYFPPDRD